MHAIWYDHTGPADQVLTFGEIDRPQPGPEGVLVRMRVSGVNPSDTKRRGGNTPMAFPRIIPHSDGAGIIEAVGTVGMVKFFEELGWAPVG